MVNSVNYRNEIYLTISPSIWQRGSLPFRRTLDMQSLELVRRFIFVKGLFCEITFKRLLDVENFTSAYQVIEIRMLEGKADLLVNPIWIIP